MKIHAIKLSSRLHMANLYKFVFMIIIKYNSSVVSLVPLRSADPKFNLQSTHIPSSPDVTNSTQTTHPNTHPTNIHDSEFHFSNKKVPNCNLVKLNNALNLKHKFETTLSYFKNAENVDFTQLELTWNNHWQCKCSENDEHNRFLYKIVGANPLISTNMKNYVLEEVAYRRLEMKKNDSEGFLLVFMKF